MEMQEIRFKGYLIIPNTDVKAVEVPPNQDFQTFQLLTSNDDIVIHSIYVSHDNAVAITLTLEPAIPIAGKDLTFRGIFSNEVKPVPFTPPIGVFKQSKIRLKAEGAGADKNIIVIIQYSRVGD